ncbi:MAG: glutamate racemase [Treponema sp.]|nr:glutamate racemase [Treponema sp.]
MNKPIIFLDSGLGCLPYAHFFRFRNGAEDILCLADRANFPYGPKTKEELTTLLLDLTERVVQKYEPKIFVIACNTATLSALDILQERFSSLPFVGTVPAVKPAVKASRLRSIGVLATARTIAEPLIGELRDQHGRDCRLIPRAAPELVEFVEHRYSAASLQERREMARRYTDHFRAAGADTLVLACTHFLLMRDDFIAEAGEDMAIIDSLLGVCKRIEFLLDEGRRAPAGSEGEARILVTGTGPLEPYWKHLSGAYDFTLDGNL